MSTSRKALRVALVAVGMLMGIAGVADARKAKTAGGRAGKRRPAPAAASKAVDTRDETRAKAPDPAPAAATPAREVADDPAPAPRGKGAARDVIQRESRIEFDERMVKGQTAAGAIYLFERGPSEMKSMVNVPEGFRRRTVSGLYPNSAEPTVKR